MAGRPPFAAGAAAHVGRNSGAPRAGTDGTPARTPPPGRRVRTAGSWGGFHRRRFTNERSDGNGGRDVAAPGAVGLSGAHRQATVELARARVFYGDRHGAVRASRAARSH